MKEKIDREIRFRIQQSLFDQFEKKCEKEYKTISEILRELVVNYLKKK